MCSVDQRRMAAVVGVDEAFCGCARALEPTADIVPAPRTAYLDDRSK